MKTKPRSTIALLLGMFLLAWAGTAMAARDIVVEYVTVTVASLNTPIALTADDTITIRNGGTLWVDDDAIIKDLKIGDATSSGTVLFSASPSVLEVVNDVSFGNSAGNSLDMAYITPFTQHVLKVGHSFLATGNGSFNAGSATVDFNGSTDQTITARIGGGGATIFYKDVVLSGNPTDGFAIKNFAAGGVSIQGVLNITQKAKAQGSSASYGSLARLQYSTAVPVTASTAEWPTTMNAKVVVSGGCTVTLDADRLLGPGGSYPEVLEVQFGGVLKDGGKNLVVQGNIANNGSIEGAGKLILGGSSFQTLNGNGNYGNVTLNNTVGGSLPLAGAAQPLIRGRLTIQSGRLLLQNGTAHQASLLTYGGADKAASILTTYGAVGSSAMVTDNTVFNNTGTGTIGIPTKPVAVLASTGVPPTLTYGTSGVTITGTVLPPLTPAPYFGDFGNGAVDGELVTVTIATSPNPLTTTAPVINGAFSANFSASGLSVGSTINVSFSYPGGINIAGNTLSPATTLAVVARPITIIPSNVTKVYGNTDPTIPFTFAPTDALVGSDYLTGTLTRLSGENVGVYDILQGTVTVTNNNNSAAAGNYLITFDPSKKLSITQKPVTVTIASTNKTYGDANPAFTATFTPALIGTDAPSGTLACTANNLSNVGSYPITKGTFTAGPNYSETFVNGNLVINKKDVVVTFPDDSKPYGTANKDPYFANSAIVEDPPLVGSDNWSGKPGRDSGETVAGGPYAFRQGTLNLGNKANNYNLSFPVSGKLTITRRPVTVSAANPNTPKYGESVAALVKYVGLVTNNNPAGVSGQTAPAVPPTITWGSKGAVTSCSLPDTAPYPYEISAVTDANDPNHTFTPSTVLSGNYTVNRATLNIRPDNKTKVWDGNLFDYNAYTLAPPNFVCNDTVANSLSGFLVYGGPAVSAVDPGVYAITPSGYTSATKYTVNNQNGYLAITTNPGQESGTDATWAAGGFKAWMINNPNGTAGANPGWSLLKLTGTLTISADSANKFRLDLVTMIGNQAGRMPKFDPTRPYSWKFVEAGSISGFGVEKFTINSSGAYLFSNPVFGGTFAIRQGQDGDANKLFIDYTPVGANRDATTGIVSTATQTDTDGNNDVDTGYNVADLLADITNSVTSDIDTLYLEPTKTGITANEDLVVNLKVANLKQPVVGVNAYINFSSKQFNVKSVVANQGVWTTLIYRDWNVGGDMDIVVGLNIQTGGVGTQEPGTVATITLTPTKTMTKNSRVLWRADGTTALLGGPLLTYLEPAVAGSPILPGRVMTPLITIVNDGTIPGTPTTAATQVQPYSGTPVNVKDGKDTTKTQVVRTGGSGAAASGPVVITITQSDAGVGLSGPPVLTLKQGSGSSQRTVTPPCDTPTAVVGPFVYRWNVPAGTHDGEWTADIVATDTIIPPNTRTTSGAFKLNVNTREIGGIVELQQFAGSTRSVQFKVGDNNSANADSVRTWDLNLDFKSTFLLNAGAFQNRAGMAARIQGANTNDTVSAYLTYGDIPNLAVLAGKLVSPTDGVSLWIHDLLYGQITDVGPVATKLTSPARVLDTYIYGRLSSATKVLLAAYQAAAPANKPALAPGLITALLNDFNSIVLGPYFYDPVRFASVPPTHRPVPEPPATISGQALIDFNRNCLWDAYAEYIPGQLAPATAQQLTQYAGGADLTLKRGLLAAFNTMTVTPTMWPSPTSPFGDCLYNEQVFVGVVLNQATANLLNLHRSLSPLPALELTLLNQMLLEDAYATLFERAPLTPGTVQSALVYSDPAAFEGNMITDLNALIGGGESIYTDERWASYAGQIDPGSELGQLLAKAQAGTATSADIIRLNRLLLELAYNTEMSKGVIAPYRLVQVLDSTSEVTATTAWNLRVRQLPAFDSATKAATVNFVNDGLSGWVAGADYSLRAGDIAKDGNNRVDLADFGVLRTLFGATGSTGAPADINGDGGVNSTDYGLLQLNWTKVGDADVK